MYVTLLFWKITETQRKQKTGMESNKGNKRKG